MIIGITGTLGAGKGTIVEFLKQHGFRHYSVRNYLVKKINKLGLEVSRDSMVSVANQIRQMNSPSYIIEELYKEASQEGEDSIIESVRTPAEAEFIKKQGGVLLAVDANPQIRYSRIILRQSETDNISFEEFLKNEQREMFSTNPNEQNLSECIDMADYIIENNKDFYHLETQIKNIYNKIKDINKPTIQEDNKKDDIFISENKMLSQELEEKKTKYVRPSWDEYFMDMTRIVAKRATCDRGRSGCVVVKDKHLLVSGYVGSPVGLPHCDDVGHQFKKMIHEDNSISNHCVRTIHAEQNAICQAAKLGIPLKDSILYCKMTPCRVCAMLIINSGIKRVVCEKKYHQGQESEEMFRKAGVQLDIINNEIEKYDNM